MDERERREHEIYGEFLVGTPIEGDADEMDRLMQVDGALARMGGVSVIRGGHADSVAGALADMKWRGDLIRDVSDDVDQL